MDSASSPGGPSPHLESLMQAGQQATRQFDDALATAMGVERKPAQGEDMSPLAMAANLHRQFWWPAIDFWRGFFTGKPAEGAASGKASRGDRRFKDDAWSHSPFYEMLKQSYLMGSKQLPELVDQAQVDDKQKLQLR